MKQENKKCWSCGNFDAYYTKGINRFAKEQVGFCRIQKGVVDKCGTCKYWQYRQRIRTYRRNLAIASIVDIREKLEVIEQILQEDHALNKIKDERDN